MTIITACRLCRREIEADRSRIVAGGWDVCDDCSTEAKPRPRYQRGGRCDRCRRPLADIRRFICPACAAGATA